MVVLDDLRVSSTAFSRFGHDCITSVSVVLSIVFFFLLILQGLSFFLSFVCDRST